MSNPLLKNNVFKSPMSGADFMTVSGTVNKSIILWLLLAVSAFYSWTHPAIKSLLLPIMIISFALAMFSIFKKSFSPFLAPIYAIGEGLILGAISLYFENAFRGVVLNAVFLTICVLFCMLAAYRIGILKATPKFHKVVILSTFAIALVYIIDMFCNIFGAGNFPYIHDSSGSGIVVNFIIVLVASLNLIIDFDLIENVARNGTPKYMEWYGAFALMITLVWLYFEMLRFLTKMRD